MIGIDDALGNPSHKLTIFSEDEIHDNQSLESFGFIREYEDVNQFSNTSVRSKNNISLVYLGA